VCAIIIVTWVLWTRETVWPLAAWWATTCGNSKEAVLPCVRSGCSGQLYSSLYGGKKILSREVHLALMRNILAHGGQQKCVQRPGGKTGVSKAYWLDCSGSKHWPVSYDWLWCSVCSAYWAMKRS
jgi:hypothetical protein